MKPDRTPTPVHHTGRALWVLTTSIAKHDIASLAAGIAFYAFFSMFPLLLLIIYALSVVLPHYASEAVLIKMLTPYFPAMSDAQELIEGNIAKLGQGGQVGLLSAVTLLWSATSGFIAFQQGLDVILNVGEQRGFVARRALGFVMLALLFVVVLCSVLALALNPEKIPFFRSGPLAWVGVVHGLSRFLFPLSLFLGFLLCFRYLPSRRTEWIYLLPGAFVATLGLDLGRQVFVWYVSHLSRYHMIYGSLTTVMFLVLWLYIGSILILFGAEVSAMLETVLGGLVDRE